MEDSTWLVCYSYTSHTKPFHCDIASVDFNHILYKFYAPAKQFKLQISLSYADI